MKPAHFVSATGSLWFLDQQFAYEVGSLWRLARQFGYETGALCLRNWPNHFGF